MCYKVLKKINPLLFLSLFFYYLKVSCFYHLKYQMTAAKAGEVLLTVAHILERKGLGHLIVNKPTKEKEIIEETWDEL